jgi:hypothetical protein
MSVNTVGEIREFAKKLHSAGYVSMKGKPKDMAFPLIPQVVAERFGVSLLLARQAVHCLHAWGLGLAKHGEFHPL